MKKIIALLCVLTLTAVLLCGCADLKNDAKKMATEMFSDDKDAATQYSGDNNGLFDDVRETEMPSAAAEENTDGISTTESNMEENFNEMVEDGKVEDGDGNVGDLENRDGDANVDEEAAEYAHDRVSSDENMGE